MLSPRREALRRLGAERFDVGDRVRWAPSHLRFLVGTIVTIERACATVDFDDHFSYCIAFRDLERL